MSDLLTSASDEALSQLVFESRETVRAIKAPPAQVLERLRKFNGLYSALAVKPTEAGLLYQDSKQPDAQFRTIGEKLVVGRLSKSEYNPEGCDIACDDDQLSRHHFEIVRADDFYLLRDLQSRNGTYLNESPDRVSEAVLKEGDIISAGNRTFIFAGD